LFSKSSEAPDATLITPVAESMTNGDPEVAIE
jgi:hypothetical protein